jgi:hypothetical protein
MDKLIKKIDENQLKKSEKQVKEKVLEKLLVYCPKNEKEEYFYLDIPDKSASEGYDEMRAAQGFTRLITTNPWNHYNHGCPILEAYIYRKIGKEVNEHIFEIWDIGQMIMGFYCKNQLHFLHLLERFCSLRMNMLSFERDMSFVDKELGS